MEKAVVQRVKDYMKEQKVSVRDLSKLVDMNENTLSCKISGVRAMDMLTICKILDAFPDLSAEWLLRGEGSMYKSKNYDQPKMSFGQFLLSTLTNCSKTEAMKVKNVVDSVVELKENEE